MRIANRRSGFFTPGQLDEMQRKLDRDAPIGETPTERENRALAIVLGRQASDPETYREKKNRAAADRPAAI
ncbi:hypothetical protein [Mesorhizobium sp. Root552]|uniref:hypothetical protein n=1 Tax=Mesorhizobium sp. Root552 TaxID=1736555 RepID=UPI0012E85B30|nr:hypothetical protein [Mesorhizobium sp. Root552]